MEVKAVAIEHGGEDETTYRQEDKERGNIPQKRPLLGG
jgi:hypothetical protein